MLHAQGEITNLGDLLAPSWCVSSADVGIETDTIILSYPETNSPVLCFTSSQGYSSTEMATAVSCGAREAAAGFLGTKEQMFPYPMLSNGGLSWSIQICTQV